MANISYVYLINPTFQFMNVSGKPLVDGYVNVYISGTRSKYYAFSDFDGTLHPFNIPLNALGSAVILVSPAHSYDIYVYNSVGTLQMSRYNITPATGEGTVITDVTTLTSKDGTVDITANSSTKYDLSIATKIAELKAYTDQAKNDAIESANTSIADLDAKKKDKQAELNFNGSATKTVKKIAQNANGELNVEFEDINYPNYNISSPDGSINVSTSEGVTNLTLPGDVVRDSAYKHIDAATANPLMNGTAAVGVSTKYAREDHVHPSDTSREDIANKTTVVLGTSDSKYPTDKAVAEFVNSSIATNTANYISNNGEPFTSVEQLEAYSGPVTNNDYAFVTGTDSEGNTYYDRYKATVSGSTVTWALEYRLNNSSFTAAQWSAINSGITSALVAKIHTHSNKAVLDGITSSDIANWNAKANGDNSVAIFDGYMRRMNEDPGWRRLAYKQFNFTNTNLNALFRLYLFGGNNEHIGLGDLIVNIRFNASGSAPEFRTCYLMTYKSFYTSVKVRVVGVAGNAVVELWFKPLTFSMLTLTCLGNGLDVSTRTKDWTFGKYLSATDPEPVEDIANNIYVLSGTVKRVQLDIDSPTNGNLVAMDEKGLVKDSGIRITSTDIANWNSKQNILTFDSEPTAGSNNPVTSDGIKTAISNSVDQTYSPTSTKAQSGVAVNEAFKTRETSSSDDSYTYLGMLWSGSSTEKLYWKLVSFNTVSNYWTLQFEIDVSNGRKGNRSFDTNIYETKRLTIYGGNKDTVEHAIELRYTSQSNNDSRGYGNNIYYAIDSSGTVTIYIYAAKSANRSQLCRLKDVINFQSISNITWYEPVDDAGTQPSNPIKFEEAFPSIASKTSDIGSNSVPVYVNRGKPVSCNSSNLKAGKDDDGNVIKNTYATKTELNAKGITVKEISGEQVICFE